jgi:hypothetical protein
MNKAFIITLFFVFSSFLLAQDKANPVMVFKGSKDLPSELNLLIDSLQSNTEQEKTQSFIMPPILSIDSYARVLSKEDIFLIGKIEIYKTLLKNNDVILHATIDGESVQTLKKAILKSNDPFIKWFLQSLLQDCDNLIGTTAFKEYLLQKNNGRIEKIDLRKIDKKVHLLFRWINKINTDESDFQNSLKTELMPIMKEALLNVQQGFFLMASATNFQKMPPVISSFKDLRFFSYTAMVKSAPAPKKNKSVDDILAPILEDNISNEGPLPEPSKENWLNEDNTPANLKNLPKPSNDADWLQDF